jgi:hypothetical protein
VSDFPSPSLVREVQELILKTFHVSEQEAHDHACGLGALAEGWGSPASAAKLDWTYRVKKDLGKKLRWRSEAERERFRADQEQRQSAYDAFIKSSNRATR